MTSPVTPAGGSSAPTPRAARGTWTRADSSGTRGGSPRRTTPCLPTLHVGHGVTRGALTVFPVWTDQPISPLDYTTSLARGGRVDELPSGPQVNSLVISNPGPLPLLLIEGSLLEAGWQHRVLLRDTLVGCDTELVAHVACVERGRWQGGAGQELGEETAPLRVRRALREDRVDQGRVWAEVDGYQSRLARTPTASLVETVRRRRVDLDTLVGDLPVLPGQRGVIIGIGGQPVSLDIVDHPDTFATRWPALLRSAAVDSLDAPAEPTPGRRARRFAGQLSGLQLTPVGTSGLGVGVSSPDGASIQVRGLATDRVLHAHGLNLRHRAVAT